MDINQEGGYFLGVGDYEKPKTLDEALDLLSQTTRKSLYKLIFDWTQEKSVGFFSVIIKSKKILEAFKKFIDDNNKNGSLKMFNPAMLNKKDYKQKHLTRILLGILYTYLIQSSLDQENIDNFSKEVHKVISPKDFKPEVIQKGTSEYAIEKTRKKETDASVIALVKRYILPSGGNFPEKKSIIQELYRLLTEGLSTDIQKLQAANAKRKEESAAQRRIYQEEIAKSRLAESELSGVSTEDALKKTELTNVIQEMRNRFTLINNEIREIYDQIQQQLPKTINSRQTTWDKTIIDKVNKIISKINATIQKAKEFIHFLKSKLFSGFTTKFNSEIIEAIESLNFTNESTGDYDKDKLVQYLNDLIKSLTFKRKELQATYLANPFASPNIYGLTTEQITKLAEADNETNHTKKLSSPGEIQNLDQVLRKPEGAKLTLDEKNGLNFLDADLEKLCRVLCTLNFGQIKYLGIFYDYNFVLNLMINNIRKFKDTKYIECNDIFGTIIGLLITYQNTDDGKINKELGTYINQFLAIDPENRDLHQAAMTQEEERARREAAAREAREAAAEQERREREAAEQERREAAAEQERREREQERREREEINARIKLLEKQQGKAYQLLSMALTSYKDVRSRSRSFVDENENSDSDMPAQFENTDTSLQRARALLKEADEFLSIVNNLNSNFNTNRIRDIKEYLNLAQDSYQNSIKLFEDSIKSANKAIRQSIVDTFPGAGRSPSAGAQLRTELLPDTSSAYQPIGFSTSKSKDSTTGAGAGTGGRESLPSSQSIIIPRHKAKRFALFNTKGSTTGTDTSKGPAPGSTTGTSLAAYTPLGSTTGLPTGSTTDAVPATGGRENLPSSQNIIDPRSRPKENIYALFNTKDPTAGSTTSTGTNTSKGPATTPFPAPAPVPAAAPAPAPAAATGTSSTTATGTSSSAVISGMDPRPAMLTSFNGGAPPQFSRKQRHRLSGKNRKSSTKRLNNKQKTNKNKHHNSNHRKLTKTRK